MVGGVHSGEVCMAAGGGACIVGGMCGGGRGHVWQGGVHGRGQGMCMVGGGHAWQEKRQLQQAVCILLECILVAIVFQVGIRPCDPPRFTRLFRVRT